MGGTICVCRKEGQITKSLLWLPWFIVNNMLECVELAEQKLGRPPNMLELYVVMIKTYPNMPIKNAHECNAVMSSLMREDWLYINDIAS